jgi:hypothetical protein
MSKTRIFKQGNFFVFQEDSNLQKINTINVSDCNYRNGNRHYFDVDKSPKYSFDWANILQKDGNPYPSVEAFINGMIYEDSKLSDETGVHRLTTAANTNDTLIKTGQTKLYKAILTNGSAGTLYVKYYDKASAPTVGTDTPLITIAVKTLETKVIDFGEEGIVFELGLGMGVTGGIADNDTTNTVANDLIAQTFISIAAQVVTSMVGTVNAGATVTGFGIAYTPVAGAINGGATVAGVLTVRPQIDDTEAVINGVATLVGVLTAKGALAGASNGSANPQGQLHDAA